MFFLSFLFFVAVFAESGFKRTLCGSKWDPVNGLTGNKNAFTYLGASTARYECEYPTFLFVDDASLTATGGYNLLTESCVMGDQFSIPSHKTLKIKKKSSVSGKVVMDRQATKENPGRHFYVNKGTLLIEGITLTGGYLDGVGNAGMVVLCT